MLQPYKPTAKSALRAAHDVLRGFDESAESRISAFESILDAMTSLGVETDGPAYREIRAEIERLETSISTQIAA